MVENCPLRHKNGNCLPNGGFCTSVHDYICEGLQQAYQAGLAEYNTSKTVIKIRGFHPICPHCRESLWGDESGGRHCLNCGKAIDWLSAKCINWVSDAKYPKFSDFNAVACSIDTAKDYSNNIPDWFTLYLTDKLEYGKIVVGAKYKIKELYGE